ncbi:hypothetical protein I308_106203 [Cryptococcus tetragattii IND107]|uniref:Uncharacterized protein n=1 Tax=Cryptococcus tetragattii IND107 TaxID=1296105 RepID=A0ABR3BJR5_9TREE
MDGRPGEKSVRTISPPKNPWSGKDHILHHHHHFVDFVIHFEKALLYTHYRGGRIVAIVGILGDLVWRERSYSESTARP